MNKSKTMKFDRIPFAKMSDADLIDLRQDGFGAKKLGIQLLPAEAMFMEYALDEQRVRSRIRGMDAESVRREIRFLEASGIRDGGRMKVLMRRQKVMRGVEKRKRDEKNKARREKIRAVERAAAQHARLEGAMRSAPGASASHRGVKSYHATTDRARREPDAPRERVSDGRAHPVTVHRSTE